MIAKNVLLVLVITLFSTVGNTSKLNAQTKAEKRGFFKRALGMNPKLEEDGSYSPSKLALKFGTAKKTDYKNIAYEKYQGNKTKILVIFTEGKNLKMENGVLFSTGNHPVEALLPLSLIHI